MKDLLELIKSNSELIESELGKYLACNGRPYDELIQSMQYSAYAGGKRIRPFLTLEVCKNLGGDVNAALPFACGIEMIHTYSLIHDDLPCMDNDDIRRGKPTNHKVYGEATALLAGDALLTYGIQTIADNRHVDPETALNATLLATVNSGFDGMIGGQVLDLMGEKNKLTSDQFLLMNKLKTGCLIKTACLLGCLAAGYKNGSNEYFAVSSYSEKIGLAFQIEDDLLDAGTEDNKTTFLTFMTQDEAKEAVRRLTDEALSIITPYDKNGVLTNFALFLAERTL